MRSLLVAIAAAAVLAALVPSTAGAAVKRCRSADLRYPFRSGQPNDFGVFKLRIRHGSCATAHRVAKEWMRRFEADLRAGHVKLPKRVYGFAFDTLDPDAAQTYNERGRKGLKTIRFDYRVPNG